MERRVTTRFSDERLVELEKRVDTLCRDFEEHVKEQKSYKESVDSLLAALVDEMKENTQTVATIAATVTELSKNSEGAIRMYSDMAAGGRILNTIGKASASILKIVAIVAAALGINHLLDR